MLRPSLLSAAALLLALPAQAQSSRPTSRPASPAPSSHPTDGLPPAFKQILPRGKIAAVRSPRYVSAKEAAIPGDAWVMGVVIEGQARAFSLNLLNRHEIVNDTIGGTPYAAVW